VERVIGTGITSEQEFRDTDGDLADPTTITLVVREPDGTRTTYVHGTDEEVVKDATGLYHFSHTPDSVGRWGYRWVGTGAVAYAEEQFVKILPSQVLE
jgi:hypothetical protein